MQKLSQRETFPVIIYLHLFCGGGTQSNFCGPQTVCVVYLEMVNLLITGSDTSYRYYAVPLCSKLLGGLWLVSGCPVKWTTAQRFQRSDLLSTLKLGLCAHNLSDTVILS